MDLFGNENQVIRTLGFYQPFGSLMHHGKIETRWVKKGKKPPFPLGKYVFYTTQTACDAFILFEWCGQELMLSISDTLLGDYTQRSTRRILSCGELVEVRPLTKEDEPKAFVKFEGEKEFIGKDDKPVTKVQWALIFKNVEQLEPIPYNHGKQGVGFLDKQYLPLLKPINQ